MICPAEPGLSWHGLWDVEGGRCWGRLRMSEGVTSGVRSDVGVARFCGALECRGWTLLTPGVVRWRITSSHAGLWNEPAGSGTGAPHGGACLRQCGPKGELEAGPVPGGPGVAWVSPSPAAGVV